MNGAMQTLQETFECFPEILQQMPAVSHLKRLGCTESGRLLIRTGAISGDDPYFRMLSKPGHHGGDLAVR